MKDNQDFLSLIKAFKTNQVFLLNNYLSLKLIKSF